MKMPTEVMLPAMPSTHSKGRNPCRKSITAVNMASFSSRKLKDGSAAAAAACMEGSPVPREDVELLLLMLMLLNSVLVRLVVVVVEDDDVSGDVMIVPAAMFDDVMLSGMT